MFNFLYFVGLTAGFFWNTYIGMQKMAYEGALPRAAVATVRMLVDRVVFKYRPAVLKAQMQRQFSRRVYAYGGAK